MMAKQNKHEQVEALTADALQFLAATNSLAAGVLAGPHTGLSDREQFMLAHRIRMLRFAQGIEATANAGLIDPAGALLRVLIELGYVLTAIAKDPDKLNDLFRAGQGESWKALKGLRRNLQPEERDDALTDAYLEEQIASLGERTGFVVSKWAELADSKASYATIYRLTSRHSHGGTTGTLDYFEGIDSDAPRLLGNVQPSLNPEYCLTAAALMLDAVTALPLETLDADRKANVESCVEEYRKLMTRYNDLGATDAH